MPLTATTFTRPAATLTNNESITLSATLSDDTTNAQFIVDFTATVNAASRIFKKLVIKPIYSGSNFYLEVKEYNFVGTQTYVSATNPAIATAVNATTPKTERFSITDLDIFYSQSGDVRS